MAQTQAERATRVYRYRVTDHPNDWLTLIAPGCDLEEARAELQWRFGAARLLAVEPVRRVTQRSGHQEDTHSHD